MLWSSPNAVLTTQIQDPRCKMQDPPTLPRSFQERAGATCILHLVSGRVDGCSPAYNLPVTSQTSEIQP
jgi:hypothetical protein